MSAVLNFLSIHSRILFTIIVNNAQFFSSICSVWTADHSPVHREISPLRVETSFLVWLMACFHWIRNAVRPPIQFEIEKIQLQPTAQIDPSRPRILIDFLFS